VCSRPCTAPPRKPTRKSPRIQMLPLALGKFPSSLQNCPAAVLTGNTVPLPPRMPSATRPTSPSMTPRPRLTSSRCNLPLKWYVLLLYSLTMD
jgi:hypothetical protein